LPEKAKPADVDYVWRHLRFGWYSLLFFVTLGLVLESLHGFKVQAYLNVANQSRRLMWTLAHAHGTLLSLVNVIFALTLRVIPEMRLRTRRVVSHCLILATFLLPGGFLLGGLVVYGGDPGLGIVAVPIGAALLLIAVFILCRGEAVSAPSGPTGGKR